MRLDKLLVHKNLVDSRSKACMMIQNGDVSVNHIPCRKPSKDCSLDDCIELSNQDKYWVSRSASKLQKAFDVFPISVINKICLDIGSSTGGFTQVLLEKGAQVVYALDVGSSQLHPSLSQNSSVILIENCNARSMDRSLFDPLFHFFCMDVSFISSSLIIPKLTEISPPTLEGVLLWKPQYEVGPKKTHHGILQDTSIIVEALHQSYQCFLDHKIFPIGFTYSPILGSNGNIEFLIYLSKMEEYKLISFDHMKRIVYEGWHFFSKTD